MAVNPDSIPRYAEPTWAELAADERTPLEWMGECTHCGACERAYQTLVTDWERDGWKDDMARTLGCEDCEEWDG